jgi:hypothetical protein
MYADFYKEQTFAFCEWKLSLETGKLGIHTRYLFFGFIFDVGFLIKPKIKSLLGSL